jgi:hypothetical protein
MGKSRLEQLAFRASGEYQIGIARASALPFEKSRT